MKKNVLMLGAIAAVVGQSCTSHSTVAPEKEATPNLQTIGRVVSTDSLGDCVDVDTSRMAVVKNRRLKPTVKISGLFSRNERPQPGDLLLYRVDSNHTQLDEQKVVSYYLYSAN